MSQGADRRNDLQPTTQPPLNDEPIVSRVQHITSAFSFSGELQIAWIALRIIGASCKAGALPTELRPRTIENDTGYLQRSELAVQEPDDRRRVRERLGDPGADVAGVGDDGDAVDV